MSNFYRLFFVLINCGLFSYLSTASGNEVSATRVALVIGNSNYKDAPLKNPINDATDMAKVLRELGFEVIHRNNLKVDEIGSTLREFKSKLNPGATAMVYYAGHGLQIRNQNFLPAVDADILVEDDVRLQSLAVTQILDLLMESKTALNLLFLDACRNNPYSRSFRSTASGGLARVDAPTGTLISYATRPGGVASDGTGRNGLYTEQLLQSIQTPGVPIEKVLKQVVSGVKKTSDGKQEPWVEGILEGEFYFAQPPFAPTITENVATRSLNQNSDTANPQAAPQPMVAPPVVEVADLEDRLWSMVLTDNQTRGFEAYLAAYPNGRYKEFAKQKVVSSTEQVNSPEPNDDSKLNKSEDINGEGSQKYLLDYLRDFLKVDDKTKADQRSSAMATGSSETTPSSRSETLIATDSEPKPDLVQGIKDLFSRFRDTLRNGGEESSPDVQSP